MYFLPRTRNKIYARAAHIQPAYRYGLTLFFLSITIAAWFFLIYRPVQSALGTYTIHNGALRAECKAGALCQKAIRDLTQDVDQLRMMVDSQETSISQCTDWASAVIDAAQRTGLAIKTYTVGKDAKKEWYCCTQGTFELSGSYAHLLTFLRDVQNLNPQIGCKNWSITRTQAETYCMNCNLYLFKTI
jgi:Tfp pilus assembly protein PilO